MKQTILQEKYPVFVLELPKAETTCANIDDVVARLKKDIAADKRVADIAVFDHYAHTSALGGEIAEDIVAARNLVFCFGVKLPGPLVLSVRPRSIGIAEMKDRYVISFMEAPMPVANEAMESWVKALKDK